MENDRAKEITIKIEKLIMYCLPILILSTHVILAIIYTAVFIVSFLCLLLVSFFVKDKLNWYIIFSIKLITLAIVNSIIQSVVLIIDPYLYTLYSMQIALMQFLPFIISYASTNMLESNITDSVIQTLLLSGFTILFAFIREFITFGSIEFSLKNHQNLQTIAFSGGISPWFAFLTIAVILVLIKFLVNLSHKN